MTATTEDPATVQGEERMLIDGALVEARAGARFDNVNPATEEVLGQVADGDAGDMDLAIAAARKAFDETSWSTDRAFRQTCLRQLQDAIVGEQELLRAELVAEVGCPIAITYGPQLDAPLEDGLLWPARNIDDFAWDNTADLFSVNGWKELSYIGAYVGRERVRASMKMRYTNGRTREGRSAKPDRTDVRNWSAAGNRPTAPR